MTDLWFNKVNLVVWGTVTELFYYSRCRLAVLVPLKWCVGVFQVLDLLMYFSHENNRFSNLSSRFFFCQYTVDSIQDTVEAQSLGAPPSPTNLGFHSQNQACTLTYIQYCTVAHTVCTYIQPHTTTSTPLSTYYNPATLWTELLVLYPLSYIQPTPKQTWPVLKLWNIW